MENEHKQHSPLREYGKFALTGGLNTVVDFGVLNLLITISGSTNHTSYTLFKSISFLGAMINSYYLNKYWVFTQHKITHTKEAAIKEKMRFIYVSVVSFFVNIIVASIVFYMFETLHITTPRMAANLGAVTGAIFTQVSNFLGYKFLVFVTKKI